MGRADRGVHDRFDARAHVVPAPRLSASSTKLATGRFSGKVRAETADKRGVRGNEHGKEANQ